MASTDTYITVAIYFICHAFFFLPATDQSVTTASSASVPDTSLSTLPGQIYAFCHAFVSLCALLRKGPVTPLLRLAVLKIATEVV